MAYKNPKDLLIDFTKFPALIEARLPEGAPKISTMLVDATGKLPAIPDFPMEIPGLPALPVFEMPALGQRYVTGVEVTPVPPGAALAVARKPLGEEILS